MKSWKMILLIMVCSMKMVCGYTQLGNLINKAKENIPQVKTIQNKPATDTKPAPVALQDAEAVRIKNQQETEWEVATTGGYSGSGARYSYEQVVKYEKRLNAYTHIRKAGELGCFHFAKDYKELQPITQPVINNVYIIFSSEPFIGGKGAPATVFNSAKSHIYARLQVNGASIKEALKLSGENPVLKVDYYIYPTEGDEIASFRDQVSLYLTSGFTDKSVIDFDIMPRPNSITAYNNPADKYSYYLSQFPFLHNNQYFPTNGNYKIGIRISSPEKDDWGNNNGNILETMGFFDYTFEAKDAKAIYDEGQIVMKTLQEGIRFTPKPLPKEWGLTSSAPVVAGYTVSKYNQLYSNFYKGGKIIKTYMSPAGAATWKVIMDNNNLFPAYKYCTQWVTFFVKDAQGRCYYHTCNLRQDYQGGGNYGAMHLAVFDEEIVYLSCGDMK
jgi:hypothetical protein